MKKLLEQIEQNPELKAKIEELDNNASSKPQDYIKVAAEYGIELTEEDFKPACGQGELSDDELNAVAGGEECICGIGGGGGVGKAVGYDEVCVCVLGGGGKYTSGDTRCVCVVAGGGDGSYPTFSKLN